MPAPSPTSGSGAAGRILLIGIVLATVLVLAASAERALGPLIGTQGSGLSTFVIEARTQPGDTSAAELWLDDLVVDGRLRRLDSLGSVNTWQAISRRGIGLPANLRARHGAAAAVVSFRGTRFVGVIQPYGWSGSIRVQRNGQVVRTIGLRNSYERVPLEAPAAPGSSGTFLVALLLFAGAAWWIAPLRRGRTSLPWLSLTLAAFHLLFWASQTMGTTNDSPIYANSIVPMVRAGLPAYFAPGYPAMLGLVGMVSGQYLGGLATLVQHGMAVVAGIWLYLILRRLISDESALLGGLLAGGLTPILTMSQSIMSEVPALFAMVGACYFTMRSAETGRPTLAILAGVLAGWAGLTRIVPLAGLLPAICLLQLHVKPRRWRLAGLTLGVCAGVMLFPVGWFSYKSGQAALTNSTGLHLFNRVVTEQRQLDESGPATRELLTRLEGKDPRGIEAWNIIAQPGFRMLTDAQAERLLRHVSLEGIRKDPGAYLLLTPRIAWRELLSDPANWIPAWGATTALLPRLETPPLLGLTAASLRWRWSLEQVHRAIWPYLCAAGLAGLILGLRLTQRALVLALASIPVGYLLSSASVDYFAPRHNVAILPFVTALAMLPLGMAISALARRQSAESPAMRWAA